MAFLAEPIWFEIESCEIGIYLVPDVVPDVLAKYNGLPGHKISLSPDLIFST
ncbi:hypothetical protein D3C87_1898830 [compost metagenome]